MTKLIEQYSDMWHYIEAQMSDGPLKDDLLRFKHACTQLETKSDWYEMLIDELANQSSVDAE